LFKYRVGDYRAIYAKTAHGVVVLRIRHRKEAYR
jgi:mRNA-degrading endonuclease RelE of RelBE toxin-antitoxin system